MNVDVVLAKGNKETEIRREFWVEVPPGGKDPQPSLTTAEERVEDATRWLLKREAAKFDSRVLPFSTSAVLNRTLSAVVFLAQRDTTGAIAEVRLDHAPSLRLAERVLAGDPPPAKAKPATVASWKYFAALMAKVSWDVVALE